MRIAENTVPTCHPHLAVQSPPLDALPTRLVVIQAEFNAAITVRIANGAAEAAMAAGVRDMALHRVPGALEIPVLLADLARKHGWNSATSPIIVAAGCVIRGDTDHYLHVCTQSIAGVQQVAIAHCLPVGNAILTVENEQQAWDRCQPGPGNKGWQAAEAALALWRVMAMAPA